MTIGILLPTCEASMNPPSYDFDAMQKRNEESSRKLSDAKERYKKLEAEGKPLPGFCHLCRVEFPDWSLHNKEHQKKLGR